MYRAFNKNLLEEIKDGSFDAIVNAVNGSGPMDGGIAEAIKEAGGESIEEESIMICDLYEPKVGTVYLTGAGTLRVKNVIHAVTMKEPETSYIGNEEEGYRNVEVTLESVLSIARLNGLKKIGCTAFGTGVGGLDPVKVASIMKEVIHDDYIINITEVEIEIVFMDFDKSFIDTLNEKAK